MSECAYTGEASNNDLFKAACSNMGKINYPSFSMDYLEPFYSNYMGNDKEEAYAFLTGKLTGPSEGGRRHRGSKKAHKGKRHGNASLRAWVTFVKKVQREEGVGYKEAMTLAKRRKDKGEKWRGGGENMEDGGEYMEDDEETFGGRRRRRTRRHRGSKKHRKSHRRSRSRSHRRSRRHH